MSYLLIHFANLNLKRRLFFRGRPRARDEPHTMQSVGHTICRSLLKHVRPLARRPSAATRLRSPVYTGLWGQGQKIRRRTARQRVLEAFPPLHDSPDLMCLLPHVSGGDAGGGFAGGWEEDDDGGEGINDYALLRRIMLAAMRQRVRAPDTETLDAWIGDGFALHRGLLAQQRLMAASSVTVTDGLMVDMTAASIPEMTHLDEDSGKQRYMFGYACYIENVHREDTIQVLGRRWRIASDCGAWTEVREPSGGVVGAYPKLAPGEAFMYVSGTQLESAAGTMSGALRCVRFHGDDGGGDDDDDDERVLRFRSDAASADDQRRRGWREGEPAEESRFWATVDPFRLEAEAAAEDDDDGGGGGYGR